MCTDVQVFLLASRQEILLFSIKIAEGMMAKLTLSQTLRSFVDALVHGFKGEV